MSLRQVKELIKLHNNRGVSHLNLKELKAVLAEHGIAIPEREPRAKRKTLAHQPTETEEQEVANEVPEVAEVEKQVTEVVEPTTEKAPDYSRLKTIRNKPRKVKITDIKSGEEVEYKSMFAAGKSLGHSSKIINDYNGKVYKDKYKIDIITPVDNEIEATPSE